MHTFLSKLCNSFKKIIHCVCHLNLNQFNVTVLNKYSRNLCATERASQALPFTLWKERKRKGGREREEEAGREKNTKPEQVEGIDGVSRTIHISPP